MTHPHTHSRTHTHTHTHAHTHTHSLTHAHTHAHRTLGTIFVCGLAWLVLDDIGWRYFVGAVTIAIILSVVFAIIFLPESPHWLLVVGKTEEALKVLRTAAKVGALCRTHLYCGQHAYKRIHTHASSLAAGCGGRGRR